MSERTTQSVLTHVEQERAMQRERWGDAHDATLTIREWNDLILEYLTKPDQSRYVRLVQAAALAVAAAEQEPDRD